MPRYIVTRKCFGFRKRLWKVGETVDVKKEEKVPKHFKLLKGDTEPAGDKTTTQ